MFCPWWQIDAGCFVQGVKKWHGMFCPGMFCPTFAPVIKQPMMYRYRKEWDGLVFSESYRSNRNGTNRQTHNLELPVQLEISMLHLKNLMDKVS